MPENAFAAGQVVTVFRSRLRPDRVEQYAEHAAEMLALARRQPGLVDVQDFTAADGERVSIITFADAASQEEWRRQVDHVAAQGRGRADYFAEYSLQVCSTVRVSTFARGAAP